MVGGAMSSCRCDNEKRVQNENTENIEINLRKRSDE